MCPQLVFSGGSSPLVEAEKQGKGSQTKSINLRSRHVRSEGSLWLNYIAMYVLNCSRTEVIELPGRKQVGYIC